ncbi:signal peptidase [Alcanivorax sp. N3-2A]|nr:signal peptidase [Alcanivorax sp. N3-2A]
MDSFDFYWRDWHWPAFNLADIAIVTGALLFVSGSLLGKKANTNAEPDGSD